MSTGVRDVLRWALLHSGVDRLTTSPTAAPAGPPPRRPPEDLRSLLDGGWRSSDAPALVQALAGETAARLGLAPPPLGDDRPPSLATAVLAAAIAVAEAGEASDLAGAVGAPSSAWDAAARHGLVLAAWPHVPPVLAGALLGASPWTAVLLHPPEGGEPAAMKTARALCAHADGRRMAVHHLSTPADHVATLTWRRALLEHLRTSGDAGAQIVLDVWELALQQHRQAWDERLEAAMGVLRRPEDEGSLGRALATAGWCVPFHRLHRVAADAVRARSGLRAADYQPWLRAGRAVDVVVSAGSAGAGR
jgi:hypothetical protein